MLREEELSLLYTETGSGKRDCKHLDKIGGRVDEVCNSGIRFQLSYDYTGIRVDIIGGRVDFYDTQ
jgi:hypothetical protein